ncbi:MAG: RNA methyltransferase [Clostridiales bacterium]|nr:RNA methyltransferase [Clostridiales bacterium]
MKTEKIFSRSDKFQRFETLKRNREKRSKAGLFFIEGVQMVEQAIRHNWHFACMAVMEGKRLSGWAEDMIGKARPDVLYYMAPELMQELSDREDTCEIIALVEMRRDGVQRMLSSAAQQEAPFFALFDRPQSPGNLGTFLRSADAFGAQGAIITGHAADVYDTQCLRGSVGTAFAIPFAHMASAEEAVDFLKNMENPPLIVGTSAKADKDISQIDLTGPVALVIGNETFGMSKSWKEKCDVLVKIPIFGAASSLNAGCAATVCFYEISRQRLAKK